MATPIRIKRSAVSGKRPQLTDLQVGELALNTYDGSLFTERDTGGVGIATTVSNLTPWTESYGASSISYLNSVGIGTDNPTAKLDINGSLNVSGVSTFAGNTFVEGVLKVTGNTVRIEGGSPVIILDDTNHNHQYRVLNNNGTFEIKDHTNSADRFTILSNGIVRSHGNFLALSDFDVAGVSTFQGNINLPDGVSARFGDGFKGEVKHTGTDLQIQETVGNIQIINYANDNDIIINTDDGSGGTTNYFRADGSTGEALLYHYGNEKIKTTSSGINVTGNVVSSGNVSGVDGTFSGNVSIGGTLTYEDVTNVDAIGLITARSGIHVVGGGVSIAADGLNVVGIATLGSGGSGQAILQKGGTTKLNTENWGIQINGTLQAYGDGIFVKTNSSNTSTALRLRSTAGDRLTIQHVSNHNYITGVVGDININTPGTVAISTHLSVSGVSTFSGINNISGEVNIGDSATGQTTNRLRIGDDVDIQIYHDSSTTNNHFIAQNGLFYLQNDNLRITSANTAKPFIRADVDSHVKLYYASNEKFATSGIGATVFGQLDTTDLNVSGVSTFSGNIVTTGISTFGDKVKISSNVNALSAPSVASNYHLHLTNPQNDAGETVGIAFGLSTGGDIGAAITHEREGTNSFGNLRFYTKENSNSATMLERMRITKDGKVGIGTDNPTAKLHISGAGAGVNEIRIDTSGTGLSFHNHSEFIGFLGNDSGKFFINAGGTEDTLSLRTNGSTALEIASNLETTLSGNLVISRNNPTISLSDSNNNPDYQIGNINGVLRFQDTTNNATRLIIDTTGKVGIGTNNPARDFHVEGTSRFNQLDVVGFSTFGGSGTKFFHHVPRVEMQGSSTAQFQLTNATSGTTLNDGMVMGFSSGSKSGFINVNESAHGFILKTGGNATSAERINISGVGTVSLRKGTTEEMLVARPDGAVELYYNNVNRLETQSWGVRGQGTIQTIGGRLETAHTSSQTEGFSVKLLNSNGAGGVKNLLEIGHTSSNSFITGHIGNISINAPTVSISTNFTVAGVSTFTGNVRINDNAGLTANVNADNLVLGESSGNHGLTILSGQNATGQLFFGDSTNTSAAGIQYFHGDNHMEFRVAGGERVRFTSGGFVGIGSEAPSHKLEVLGDSSLKGNLNATGITTLSGNVTLNAGASALMQLKFRNNVTGFGANDGADVAYSTNSHGMFFSAYESAGHMIFQTAGNNLNNRSLIISNTGVVTLQRNQENMLVATPNSHVKLYFDGEERLETTNTGVGISSNLNVSGIGTIGSGASGQADLQYQGVSKFKTQSWGNFSFGSLVATGDLKVNAYNNGGSLFVGQSNEFEINHDTTNTTITEHVGDININASTVAISTNMTVGGIVTATSFDGALPISNDANNRLITASGSGGLNAEGGLTYDGDQFFTFTGSGYKQITASTTTNNSVSIKLQNQVKNFTITNVAGGLFKISEGSASRMEIQNGLVTFPGNVSIGGTLTYEDVTNIDSVGVITAQNGLNVTSGVSTFASEAHFLGRVGIGTADPNESLDIVSAINSQTMRIWSKGLSNASTLSIRTGDSGNSRIHFGDNSDEDIGEIRYVHGDDSMRFITNTGERLRINASGQLIFDADTNTHISRPAADTLAFTTAGSEILRILSSGNIGIGTDIAPHKLSVKGTISKISGTSGIQLVNIANDASQNGTIAIQQSGGVERVKLHSSGASYFNGGNVGIVTNNPSARLHIGPQNGDSIHHLYLASGNNDYGIVIDTQDYGSQNVPLRIFTRNNNNDTERIRLKNSGEVGIGTDDPDAKLDVNVGSSVTAFNVSGSQGQLFSVTNNLSSGSIFSVNDISGSPSVDVDADGTIQLAPLLPDEKVGIGTTNPDSKLHVFGNVVVGHGNTHTPSGLGTGAGVGIVTCDVIHLRGGGFVAPVPLNSGNQVVNDAAIVVPENFHIYNLESDGKYFRNLLEKNNGVIALGQPNTNTISKVRLYPGNLSNGNVELYNNNDVILSTSDTGVVVTGILTATSTMKVGLVTALANGNVSIGGTFEIFESSGIANQNFSEFKLSNFSIGQHNNVGTMKIMNNNNTGTLLIGAGGGGGFGGIILYNKNLNAKYLDANNEGSVDLYYDGEKRFETTGIGASVLGQLDTTDINASGIVTVTTPSASKGARNISISTEAPSGGSDGDLWFTYIA